MNERLAAGIFGGACIIIGIVKAARPSLFIDYRERHPWINFLGFYSFIFKTKYARPTIVTNGIILILMGLALFIWSQRN